MQDGREGISIPPTIRQASDPPVDSDGHEVLVALLSPVKNEGGNIGHEVCLERDTNVEKEEEQAVLIWPLILLVLEADHPLSLQLQMQT